MKNWKHTTGKILRNVVMAFAILTVSEAMTSQEVVFAAKPTEIITTKNSQQSHNSEKQYTSSTITSEPNSKPFMAADKPKVAASLPADAAEARIELEDWMLDANNKFWIKVQDYLQFETEDDIVLEEWMTDLSQWL